MKRQGLSQGVFAALILFVTPATYGDEMPQTISISQVGKPPGDWALNAFYRKAVMVDDFPIISSQEVRDQALLEAAYIVSQMLEHRPDLLQQLASEKVRLVVMSYQERTTDIPEHSDLTPADYWDRRARGLGATRARPAVSCAEENLLCFPDDPYSTENILVHEFAHAIDEMALRKLDPEFEPRLIAAYQAAKADGLWNDLYAMTNPQEYWAEGVQSYFGTNRENDASHNHVNTRIELEAYDPRLFALIDHEFRSASWQYIPPKQRPESSRQHFRGYDFNNAPRFSWGGEDSDE